MALSLCFLLLLLFFFFCRQLPNRNLVMTGVHVTGEFGRQDELAAQNFLYFISLEMERCLLFSVLDFVNTQEEDACRQNTTRIYQYNMLHTPPLARLARFDLVASCMTVILYDFALTVCSSCSFHHS